MKGGVLISVIALVAGLYLINSAFSFIPLPDFFGSISKYIVAVAGALLILGGLNQLKNNMGMMGGGGY